MKAVPEPAVELPTAGRLRMVLANKTGRPVSNQSHRQIAQIVERTRSTRESEARTQTLRSQVCFQGERAKGPAHVFDNALIDSPRSRVFTAAALKFAMVGVLLPLRSGDLAGGDSPLVREGGGGEEEEEELWLLAADSERARVSLSTSSRLTLSWEEGGREVVSSRISTNLEEDIAPGFGVWRAVVPNSGWANAVCARSRRGGWIVSTIVIMKRRSRSKRREGSGGRALLFNKNKSPATACGVDLLR